MSVAKVQKTADLIAPRDEAGVIAAVNEARSSGAPLEIAGSSTKRAIGRPMQTAATLTTAKLTGVTLYEPSELVIGAKAGTPLKAIEKELEKNRQRLPFEPVDYRKVLVSEGEPTIGAVAAANLSGPRRIYAGAARDCLIGVRMVTGRGEAIKSGGRVMKNVTGYDLVKLSAGSWGTLGVLTEVTLKVLPVPETETTLVYEGLGDKQAIACLSEGLGSPFEVTGAAHLPAGIDGAAKTLLRRHGVPALLQGDASQALWVKVRDAEFFAAQDRALWRISVMPSRGPEVAAVATGAGGRVFYDWGGGLIWAAIPAEGDVGAGALRSAIAGKGHATLIRAPEAIRASVDVFQPEARPVAALTRAVKDIFDPDHVLNPGRMYAGS